MLPPQKIEKTTPSIRQRRRAATPVVVPMLPAAEIVQRDPATLVAYKKNARTHSKKQIQQIAASIRQFGFNNPVLIDQQLMILAGHGRVEAAKLLGLKAIPTLCLDHLSPAEQRAYILADNRLAEKAGWDRDLLRLELQELSVLDLDFEIELTGFDTAEIDLLIDSGHPQPATDPADAIPDLPAEDQVISRDGDLWLLGQHRLYCGDALDPASYTNLLEGLQAQMVFTDPPYNVPVQGHVCGKGSIRHDEFIMASGEMTPAEFTDFLTRVFTNLKAVSADGAIQYYAMDWRHCGELLAAAQSVGLEQKNLCVWNKDNGGMGSFYRSKHELIFVFKVGSAPHINNFGLGEKGRYRTNVWDYPGINTLKTGRLDELAMHPTVKPVALVADAIRDCSKRGGLILDAFMGSGTTIMAAARTSRVAYGLELDPRYVDTAIRRWERQTGQPVQLVATGQAFAEVAADRGITPSGQR